MCTAVTFSTTLENTSFDATNVSGEIKPANEAGSSFDSFDNGAFEIGGSISTSGRPRETSLLMSPLVVAGIVIGLVLVLSCVTIIAGSLKKDSRMRGSQLGMMPAQGRDSLSLSGSLGELSLSRTECLAGLEPELCTHSISLSLCMSHVPLNFMDAPPRFVSVGTTPILMAPSAVTLVSAGEVFPQVVSDAILQYNPNGKRYEDCLAPGALFHPSPMDEPPAYSITDPCQPTQPSECHRPNIPPSPPSLALCTETLMGLSTSPANGNQTHPNWRGGSPAAEEQVHSETPVVVKGSPDSEGGDVLGRIH